MGTDPPAGNESRRVCPHGSKFSKIALTNSFSGFILMSVTITVIDLKGGFLLATLKFSRQRESIKTYLASTKEHPTADMVYMHVKEEYPNISLGTVYRNLNLLSDIVGRAHV